MTTDRPSVAITPGLCWGRPHVKGISVEAIAGSVMGNKGVDVAADDYDLTRADVLVACWWAGVYGEPRLRRLWGAWADDVYPLLAATGADYDAVPDPSTDVVAVPELSPRELDVLHGIAAGKTAVQIGDDLGTSINTVRSQTSRLYRKLGVHGRIGAVNAGRELGLLPGGGA